MNLPILSKLPIVGKMFRSRSVKLAEENRKMEVQIAVIDDALKVERDNAAKKKLLSERLAMLERVRAGIALTEIRPLASQRAAPLAPLSSRPVSGKRPVRKPSRTPRTASGKGDSPVSE